MKIAVPSSGAKENDKIEARFGRAAGFVVFDDEKKSYSYFNNEQNLNAAQGAGIQSAKTIVDSGSTALIACNVGPKAFDVLHKSGVGIYLCPDNVTIKEAVDRFAAGKLSKMEDANAQSHW